MIKVGVLGAGQLARMLALAGHPLGISLHCMDSAEEPCAGPVAKVINGDFSDQNMLQHFASDVDVMTYETENIPVQTIQWVSQICPVYPGLEALALTQDRLTEKMFCQRLQIPTVPYAKVDSLAELEQAVEEIGLPAILKTRRFGYDGKGQFRLTQQSDISQAWQTLGGQPLILEQWVSFDREVSLIGVRALGGGDCRFYSLVENHHKEGILDYSTAPCFDSALQQLAQSHVEKMLVALDYVGVFTVEFFQQEGTLVVNEMAPRVHNSGHWTIEGAVTSQFENHLRAITGLPLGEVSNRGVSVMINCVGVAPAMRDVLQISGAHYHFYGKSLRAKRKLAHITLSLSAEQDIPSELQKMKKIIAEGQ